MLLLPLLYIFNTGRSKILEKRSPGTVSTVWFNIVTI